ncbi:MAG: SprT-like domain-containing protein [Waddliaceae bacterium]
MPLSSFQKQLENDLKKSVKLIINNNRSTMLSVKWEPNCTKVSMHRFFLSAPENVMDALVCYIKQEDRSIAPSLKSFIAENIQKLDYSHCVNRMNLDAQGETYNLKSFMNDLNKEYFDDKLNLNITWFGKKSQCNRSQVTFGMYYDSLKLIKINRLLDNPTIPEHFVTYVVYHEMLHHACPSYCDENGRNHIHNKEFKMWEMKFRDFHKAQEWIKENREKLFSNNRTKKRRKLSWQAIVSGPTSSIRKKGRMPRRESFFQE